MRIATPPGSSVSPPDFPGSCHDYESFMNPMPGPVLPLSSDSSVMMYEYIVKYLLMSCETSCLTTNQ